MKLYTFIYVYLYINCSSQFLAHGEFLTNNLLYLRSLRRQMLRGTVQGKEHVRGRGFIYWFKCSLDVRTMEEEDGK